jgi:hypothetical protein
MDPGSPRSESPLTELPPPEVKLDAGAAWIPVLSIPTDDISLYTLRPLKWLRYLGFAIYGCEGTLSLSADGPEIDDYNTADVGSLRETFLTFTCLQASRSPLEFGN